MKYFIKTYGCQMNASDSERIAAFLENKGYEPIKGADSSAEALAKADLIVINACSVRQSAIDRILGLKPKFKKLKTRKILTGCVLKSDKRKFQEFFDEVLDIKEFLGQKYLSISSNSTFVPIMTGCDNFCSYCVVPYVRGREKSRPANEIINEIKKLIKQGYKEITLLGQNVNSYLPRRQAGKYGFVDLLKDLNKIPGDFKIKFITNHPKDFSDQLINLIAKSKKIVKEIHLPIQSGDDGILKKMNRKYTVKQYKNLIKKIQKKIPNIKISTDVIVGFPNETKKQFENTVKLFKQIKYDKAYINKYSPRVGTASYKLKDNVPWQEKRRRWKVLDNIIKKKSHPTPKATDGRPQAEKKEKIIVVLGSTATGKSDLAVKVAKDFNGEIVSVDSRQIYKGMDIGTGKITKKQMQGISHHLLDIVSPKKQITVTQYRKKALKAIDEIYKKNKVPILCGGTGFYIQAITQGITIPEVKLDSKLRKQLENKTTEQLFKQLKKLDPRRAREIDSKNKRRLIRALEIVLITKKPVPCLKKEPQFRVLYLGIKKNLPELKKSIDKRVDKMIKQGLEKEVKKITAQHGWTIILKNAIGYSEFSPCAAYSAEVASATKAGKASGDKERIINLIKVHSLQFAKRQMTWFKSNKKINWLKNYQQAQKLIKKFLK